jgi:hypothetical protein
MGQREDRRIRDCAPPGEEAPPGLVPCFWCERLHAARHPLSVCPECAARLTALRLLEMSGSYPLSDEAIDRVVTRTSPGNFALGYLDGGTFAVFLLGRSDSDVRRRLHEWVGMPSRYRQFASPAKAPWGRQRRGTFPVEVPALDHVGNVECSYTRFAYSYASSAEAAFEKECRNFEDFARSGVLDNETPPARSAGDGRA